MPTKNGRFGPFQEGGVYIPQTKAWGLDTESDKLWEDDVVAVLGILG